ncbi:MAG TPA: hypothetical protein GX702_00335 [Chloroflexi bacterium]|nr:hypothetical protein [Chloroflexota bacterium]
MAEIEIGKGRLMTTHPTDEIQNPTTDFRITREILAYAVILLGGLAVRLVALGRWPLLEGEIGTALAAWRALQGQGAPVGGYVPALFNAQFVLFALTRAGDFTVRLLPALVGAGLPLLSCLMRPYLGRRGALAAASILAFAPTWVYASRTADGAIMAAAAGGLLVVSVWRFLTQGHASGLRWGAVALGAGLAMGPTFYTVPVVAMLYGAMLWLWKPDARVRLKGLAAAGGTRRNALLAASTFAALAGGFLLVPAGMGTAVESAADWFRGLLPGSDGLPWTYYIATLLTYEFLTVAPALVGAVVGLRRRDEYDGFFVFWAVLALLLGSVLGHRHPQWLPVGLLPMVFLAGRGVEWLWERVGRGADTGEWPALPVGLVPLGTVYIGLAAYLRSGQTHYLTYCLMGAGMGIVAWSAYRYWMGREAGLRVLLGLALVALLVPTVRATTALTYETARNPRERMVVRPTSMQFADLVDYMSMLSLRATGKPYAMEIEYEAALDPWMSWYLRDFDGARRVQSVGPQPHAVALVTAPREDGAPSGEYVGRRYRLQESRPEQSLSLRERLRWFLYRYPAGEERATELWLWVLAEPMG